MRTKLSPSQLASMSPWTIAEHYGLGYSGDMNPFDHGGFFYDYRDWNNWGYASAIEIWHHHDNGKTILSDGTINKPEDMSGAFKCIGVSNLDDRSNVLCQIEAARAYYGMESGETLYREYEDNEERFWEMLRDYLEQMANN